MSHWLSRGGASWRASQVALSRGAAAPSARPLGCTLAAFMADDNAPRSVTKPDGRVIELATLGAMKAAFADGARVLDVRDQNEVDANKGGATVSAAMHAPVNVNGEAQSTHPTTVEEFAAALTASGVDLAGHQPSSFVVHCTGGGRAHKACGFLHELGFTALNGGGPADVASCFEASSSP